MSILIDFFIVEKPLRELTPFYTQVAFVTYK
jgi:hypothetical protein